MNVRKFTGSTSREAWHLVREALGPDAVILSNRSVDGGVEILALAGEDMAALAEPVMEKQGVSAQTLSALTQKRNLDHRVDHAHASAAALTAPVAAPIPTPAAAAAIGSDELGSMMQEIRSMRGMLEAQLAELAWTDQHKREPVKAAVLREMLAAGFSASLSRYVTEKLPAGATEQGGVAWLKSVLARNLSTISSEHEILEKGGVYALVGPTGVGKTTTTAKLAARCVMRHGPSKLALITTDGYRIGGYEQLRIYGKILGVMVHSVKDEADLRIALDELKGKHTVLIDTVGVSQRDQMVTEQIAMLSAAGNQVKRLLCLNATSTGETLNEVVRSYQGTGLAGCILTKLDEAATIGNALDVVIRQKLNLYYIANGQRVPEDLHVANAQYLVDRAFKLKRETAPFQFQDAEIPLVMANTARAMNDKSLREVILG
jgi:flagellar biosynthesis protein FlhF